jgi:uncharacterized protein
MIALSLIPEGIENLPLYLALGSASVMLVGIAKAGFGGSIGLLSVPLMIYACGGRSQLATAAMLPILIVCDQVALVSWWGKWNFRIVLLMLPGAIVGIALAGLSIWGFQTLDVSGKQGTADAALQLGIGVISLGFVTLSLIRAIRGRRAAFRPTAWHATAAGLGAGYTSTLAHAAGPITTMYLLPQQMSKERYVATTVLYYWFGNLIKLAPYGMLGMLDARSMKASVTFLPAIVVGALLGVFLHHRVKQNAFTGIVYVLLSLTGVHLVIKGVRALLQ